MKNYVKEHPYLVLGMLFALLFMRPYSFVKASYILLRFSCSFLISSSGYPSV